MILLGLQWGWNQASGIFPTRMRYSMFKLWLSKLERIQNSLIVSQRCVFTIVILSALWIVEPTFSNGTFSAPLTYVSCLFQFWATAYIIIPTRASVRLVHLCAVLLVTVARLTSRPRPRSLAWRIYCAIITYPSPLSGRYILLQPNEVFPCFICLDSSIQIAPFPKTFNGNKVISSLLAQVSAIWPGVRILRIVPVECVTRAIVHICAITAVVCM